jgi:hypothetical protein
MATTKFSQIATTVTAPATTDFFVGVQSGSTDVLYTQAQINTSVSSALGLSSYTPTSALAAYATTSALASYALTSALTSYAPLASPVFTGLVNVTGIAQTTSGSTGTVVVAQNLNTSGSTDLLAIKASVTSANNSTFIHGYGGTSGLTSKFYIDVFGNLNVGSLDISGLAQLSAAGSSHFTIINSGLIGWSPSTNELLSADTVLTRSATGVVAIGLTGSNASGSLNLTNLTASGTVNTVGVTSSAPVYFPRYTVTTLPAATTGAVAIVTDALAPTFLGLLTGGGTSVTLVLYNGSAWTVT